MAQRLGLVGARSLGAARWCCAQLAARTGGATVTFLLRGGVQEGRPPSGVTAPGARAHAHVGAATGPGGGLPAPARDSSASTTDVGDAADARSGGGGGGGPSVAEVCVLGDGRTPVHVVEGGECPLCRPLPPPGGEGGRPSSAPSEQRADPRTVHIGIAATYRDLPAWCDRAEEDPTPPVSPAWWAQVAHPGPPGLGAGPHPGVLPDRVLLEELAPALRDHRERSGTPAVGPSGSGGAEGTTSSTVGVPDGDGAGPGASGSRGGDPTGLPAVIGVGTWGHHVIDLVRDGPHALLAGTTGAGKSEALATWLVSLALGHPPERLRLVLIDYKGGAALGPFAALPHTEAVLTDLDPAATDRALRGLSSLLRHRERQLAEMGLPDLQRWEAAHASGRAPAPPPRVVVVVDEFRVLADSHPSTLDSLVRLSAQGRSLGLHLVAATQRPAGALTPAMRANIEIRLALRCAEEADSLDVLGSPAAARLPRVPGRALLRGVGPLQVAWVPDLTWALALVGRRWDGRGGPVASGGAHSAAVARDGSPP
ncbi:FtsK/SpoIIIE domain-containing protein, partial [Actinomyces polynesiensis]|uniref:FtsK/SpoIIIE domain-containing protein n=1 Tax=Actinomyces polynesiensis TaxID=1325934 RepID=UPI0022B1DE84